uniref:Conserved hypothethical protein n=1 Tax=Ralstonia solanacearum TaxID=305 RepID=A0A0S4TVL1_RALSL|nr:Conserved hypothethical protein [Ralstonia solanacearum]
MAFTVSLHWREPGIPGMSEPNVGPLIGKDSQKDMRSLKNDPNGRRLRFDNRHAAQDQHGGRRSPVPGRAIR